MNDHRLFYAIVMVGASLASGAAMIACSSSSSEGATGGAQGNGVGTTTADASLDATDFDATDAWPTTK
jgi:hypothetical protein